MKIFRILIITSLAFVFPMLLIAQDVGQSVEQIIADIYEQLLEDEEVSINFEDLYDDLMSLVDNPINLNQTNKEEMDKLQFLSDLQIDNILYYLYRNSPMHSIFELQLIDGLDMLSIQRMLPFVYVGEAVVKKQKLRLKDVSKYGKNEIYLRLDRALENKAGYNLLPDEAEGAAESNAKKYVGDPYYNHLKYRFKYRNNIQFGVTAEKDAGEQFWGEHNRGYDFYSAFFELKDIGKLKTLVVGDYRANFGQGLIMRTDFSMGKSSYVMQVSPRASGLKKFSSTAEYDIFRGVGATVRLGKFDITGFYSAKKIDGDTINGSFSSIVKTGLHRTTNDLSKKNTVLHQVAGADVTFNHQWFQVGATAYYAHFDHSLQPRSANYNRFYFSGNEQKAASVNYKLRWHKMNIFGEAAMTDRENAYAFTNGMSFNPVSRVSFVALHRYFSKEYDVLYGRTFSETARVNNETGFYIGAEVIPFRYWKLSGYIDSYQFPWNKFGVDAPSIGKDYLLQMEYSPRRDMNMYWRFKYEENSKNYTDTATVMPVLTAQPKWQARYQLNYRFGRFNFKNQLDANGFNNGVDATTYGFSAFQDIKYEFKEIPLAMNMRLQAFDVKNFNNRVYVYESDVLYAFSVPMSNGVGARYYLNLKYSPIEKLTLWLKLAQTVYADDRLTIGTGNEEIVGNRRSDMRFLLRWKF